MGTMFTYVIASAMHRGLDISCGCFGVSGTDTISYFTLIRAVAILVCGVFAYSCLIFVRAGEQGYDRDTGSHHQSFSKQGGNPAACVAFHG